MKKSLIKTKHEIELMAEAGRILAKILTELSVAVTPGTTTKELNSLANDLCKKYNVRPAFLGFNGYPASVCISINSVVVHGIPTAQTLKSGDVVGIDMGVVYKGYCSDSAVTVPVGSIDRDSRKLITATEEALKKAISIVKEGVTIGDIGRAIEQVAVDNNLGIVHELTGHGIGRKLQEEPSIPNYGNPDSGMVLKAGMTIAIEPMFTLGDPKVTTDNDGWTIRTKDDSKAAHFEHTILVTKTGCKVLTDRK